MTRTGIYKALGAEGDPKLSTVLGVLSALGIILSIEDDPSQASPSS